MTNTVVAFFTCVALVLLPSVARADDLADAKAFITKQMDQIKKTDVDGLKAGFSKRQAGKITKEMVTKAQTEAAKYTIEDLVEKVAPGKDTLKIKMKGGRTLTTLVKEDGAWKADTLWFK
ncbi:MAG: hypothetical protein ABI678_26750 [Kofleriaceae bacterium]